MRIRRRDVTVIVSDSDGVPSVSIELRLGGYELPPDAPVVFEAIADWTLMRFSAGDVQHAGASSSFSLSEFGSADGISYRVKVLGTGEREGMILAEADGLRPESPELVADAKSFVRVRPSELGAVVWSVTVDDDGPLLLVNRRLDDWRAFLRSGAFRALVLPAVFREIFRRAIEAPEAEGDAESASWVEACRSLTRSLGVEELESTEDDDVEAWIDDAVRAFAHRNELWRYAPDAVAMGESV